MSVSISIEMTPEAKLVTARFGMMPQMSVRMRHAMDKENQLTVGAIKNKISGSPQKGLRGSQVLHRRTGRLINSIGRTDAIARSAGSGISITSGVGSGVGQGSYSVRYAAIHEFGGTISVPGRASRSKSSSRMLRHPETKAYKIEMPERSYIRSTINDRKAAYSSRMSNAIIGFLKTGGTNV